MTKSKRRLKKIGEFSNIGCLRRKLVRGNYVVECGNSLKDNVTNINLTETAVAIEVESVYENP